MPTAEKVKLERLTTVRLQQMEDARELAASDMIEAFRFDTNGRSFDRYARWLKKKKPHLLDLAHSVYHSIDWNGVAEDTRRKKEVKQT